MPDKRNPGDSPGQTMDRLKANRSAKQGDAMATRLGLLNRAQMLAGKERAATGQRAPWLEDLCSMCVDADHAKLPAISDLLDAHATAYDSLGTASNGPDLESLNRDIETRRRKIEAMEAGDEVIEIEYDPAGRISKIMSNTSVVTPNYDDDDEITHMTRTPRVVH